MEKKSFRHPKFERELNYHYSKFGRSFNTMEGAIVELTSNNYEKIDNTTYKNKHGNIAYLTRLRDCKIDAYRRPEKYYAVGWLITYKHPFSPIDNTNCKLSKCNE